MFCDNFGDMESARNNRGTAATVPAAFELSGTAPGNTTNGRREIPSRTLVRRAPHGLRYVAVNASAACWRHRDARWCVAQVATTTAVYQRGRESLTNSS